MEDNNLFDHNQHQLMKSTPIFVIGPNLVFLAPTKKGSSCPILKCKILLASLMLIFDCHQSATQPYTLINTVGQSLLITRCWSISAHQRSLGMHHQGAQGIINSAHIAIMERQLVYIIKEYASS